MSLLGVAKGERRVPRLRSFPSGAANLSHGFARAGAGFSLAEPGETSAARTATAAAEATVHITPRLGNAKRTIACADGPWRSYRILPTGDVSQDGDEEAAVAAELRRPGVHVKVRERPYWTLWGYACDR